ncbi:ATP-dependent DNA helicase [Lacticaseibacillus pabuli]|uniref:ATP-dependent DNA helicase n=1 Tax=Lacticaseibacillus pabuli TaxID=3025672 RepID=A0ABY7WQK0_9LACO|nr:ATP-dependent DNA helicase [Lacticaseibacillus sp. KACC 23028]WDF82473.1 ATP-dependent DNA helicase [Lacticaseibacillus sp. KACC 23028]
MLANRIGVRELVEFTVRTGDLNPANSPSANTAALGSRIHRQVQDAHDESGYESEVYLKTEETVAGQSYTIDGRADGVLTSDDGVLLEEIKTSARDFDKLPQNTRDRYWAQAKVYGHYLCDQRDLPGLTIDLIYFDTREKKAEHHKIDCTAAELTDFYDHLLAQFAVWIQMRSDIITARNKSAQALHFPFPKFRTGQHELAGAVYKTIYSNNRLFALAPTGTGKTISTLFPTIKAMGEGLINRAFYLTAKAATRTVAEDAMALMAGEGLMAKSITLTARDTIKFNDEPDEPSENPYMLGYYDRLLPALQDMLANENQLTRSVIERYAQKHTLDPFEFSLDASLFCDVVICDYNYLFDPRVFLQRFFAEDDSGNFFLIDEAHNLVDRARNMYSAAVDRESFVAINEDLKDEKGRQVNRLKKSIRECIDCLDIIAGNLKGQEHFQKDQIEELRDVLDGFTSRFHDWLEMEPTPQSKFVVDTCLDTFFLANAFLKIGEFYDDGFVTRIYRDDGKLFVKLLCLNPSPLLDASMKKGGGAVLFSATLSPMNYYRDMLGGVEDSMGYTLPSPFPPDNQRVIACANVDTTYRQRQNSLPTITACLTAMVRAKNGNYMVFAPSYAYLDMVHQAFVRANPDLRVVAQESGMTASERTAFLDAFADGDPVTGFAVLGGSFSEGIDLRGDALLGSAIVSVGLPGLSGETDQLRDYYQERSGQGFAYAYQLPGFNNVLQAAGRVIRGERDVGVVLLLDRRFATRRYTELFPPQWSNYDVTRDTRGLATNLTTFWQGHQTNEG